MISQRAIIHSILTLLVIPSCIPFKSKECLDLENNSNKVDLSIKSKLSFSLGEDLSVLLCLYNKTEVQICHLDQFLAVSVYGINCPSPILTDQTTSWALNGCPAILDNQDIEPFGISEENYDDLSFGSSRPNSFVTCLEDYALGKLFCNGDKDSISITIDISSEYVFLRPGKYAIEIVLGYNGIGRTKHIFEIEDGEPIFEDYLISKIHCKPPMNYFIHKVKLDGYRFVLLSHLHEKCYLINLNKDDDNKLVDSIPFSSLNLLSGSKPKTEYLGELKGNHIYAHYISTGDFDWNSELNNIKEQLHE